MTQWPLVQPRPRGAGSKLGGSELATDPGLRLVLALSPHLPELGDGTLDGATHQRLLAWSARCLVGARPVAGVGGTRQQAPNLSASVAAADLPDYFQAFLVNE